MEFQIDNLLKIAYAQNASDLHITAQSPPILRIDGKLISYGDTLLTGEKTEQMAKALLQKDEWSTFLKQGEVDLAYSIENVARFRLNIYRQRHAVSIAARVIPTDIPTLEQLNMPGTLQQLIKKPQGLILVTGPTGSGKTTTLAAMIDYINRHKSKHIITLEDPIEMIHNNVKSIVQQREVGSDTQSFTNGLRAALRQDPDIILVGEMRDLETISTAVTAAETGHLVLATLHTNSAAETINRIIDVFPPHQQAQIRIQLASILAGIVSQRLIPRIEGSGRIAATEVLISHPSVANLIRNEKVEQIKNVLQTSRSLGMHTLDMSIQSLVGAGIISPDYASSYLSSVGDD